MQEVYYRTKTIYLPPEKFLINRTRSRIIRESIFAGEIEQISLGKPCPRQSKDQKILHHQYSNDRLDSRSLFERLYWLFTVSLG
ncbi:hypothetical protein ACQY1Y_22350 [Microcystis ichthyoblabe FBCC-A1114]|uniref:hypothetical protein n=1 Tax=Microcystis TaxID=1125 RepID=UPI003D29DE7C